MRESFYRRNHIFLISAVVSDSAHLQIRAVPKVSAPALQAGSILPTMPAHSYSLSLLPRRDAAAHLVNHTRHLVPRHTRIRYTRPRAFLRQHITVANSASLHLDSNLSRSRLRNLALHHFKFSSRLRHLHRFHLRHRLFSPSISLTTNNPE